MERRDFLKGLTAVGCSAAAHPLLTTVTLAQGTGLGENRLIVVILRGGMDGLDVVQPLGDPDFAALRPAHIPSQIGLTGPFALHPGLGGLQGLWQAGQLGFVHATSTPYRDKRSHFDGQTLLESGTGMDVAIGAQRDGWLNRMLQAVPGLRAETAYAVGREALPLLAGPGPSRNWTPEVNLVLSAQSHLLLDHIYHDDDLFRDAGAEAMTLSAELSGREARKADARGAEKGPFGPGDDRPWPDVDTLVDFAAGRLRAATRIAAFSLSGWDTHRGQNNAIGRPLSRLQRIILRMQAQLGAEVWGRTTLLAMTEFGRTARQNGSGGTDHGTGGLMVMAGGALRGGHVFGPWPGLSEAALYDRRDLMPTSDVRAWAAWAMRGLYGLEVATLEGAVFPGLEMGPNPGLIL
ncbi:DUF1501 domain-containing protein [Pseudorhodobacter sp. E13]|uniref:DUF1501 domain-containing protein n=1 Tax=Pseudorhodobacter sp. E13 TaxID=2487931 RepID=UPI000F8ECFD4|nr:DUF1501 domain-containing protein [Pseudorhodobacter sp. E13]RUS60707.1 DUF1501 domain-containing protein [Pseudorhodobacter sp. E13]